MSTNLDINGKESSKRYWAKRFFTLGFWLAIGLFVLWGVNIFFFNDEFTIPDALIEIWKWMMGFASAVILGTVFEKPEDSSRKDEFEDWEGPPKNYNRGRYYNRYRNY